LSVNEVRLLGRRADELTKIVTRDDDGADDEH
jgi:hypothetical protein